MKDAYKEKAKTQNDKELKVHKKRKMESVYVRVREEENCTFKFEGREEEAI